MKVPARSSSSDWQIATETVLFFLIGIVSAWPVLCALDAILRMT
jgi:hypothetical protein